MGVASVACVDYTGSDTGQHWIAFQVGSGQGRV